MDRGFRERFVAVKKLKKRKFKSELLDHELFSLQLDCLSSYLLRFVWQGGRERERENSVFAFSFIWTSMRENIFHFKVKVLHLKFLSVYFIFYFFFELMRKYTFGNLVGFFPIPFFFLAMTQKLLSPMSNEMTLLNYILEL